MSRRNLTKQPKFIHPAAKSRWKEAKRGTAGLVNIAGRQPIGFFHSHYVIPYTSFTNDTRLKKKVRALSTNVDRNGTEFVSTFEGKIFWAINNICF